MIKHLQGLHKPVLDRDDDDIKEDIADNSALNLSRSQSDIQEDVSLRSDSDIGEADAATSDEDGGRTDEDGEKDPGRMGSMFQMMNHIQSLISRAVENAKQDDAPNGELKTEEGRETQSAIKKKIDEESKTTDFYLKRFRKEKRLRKRLQEQLDLESRKIQKLEAALRNISYDTLVKVKESIAREAAQREKEKITKSAVTEKTASNGEASYLPPPAVSSPNTLASSPAPPLLPSGPAGLQPPPNAGDFHSLNYSLALDRVMEQQQRPPPVNSTASPVGGFPTAVSSSY